VFEVLRFESAKLLVRRGSIAPSKSAGFLLVLGASVLIPAVLVSAQSSTSPQTKKTPPGGSNPPATAAVPAGPPPGQIWLPPLQATEHTPVIAWDGKLLTIDADNSSLSDILLAIRSHTGASIEMPGSTSRERIAIHLGPAPVREVISALLYGTDFNYVIQSSEDDTTALGKVIITSHDGDDSDDIVTADADSSPSSPSNPSKPKTRLMPGYAAPGKRDFEVTVSGAGEEPSSTAETPAEDSSAPGQDQPAVAAGTDSKTTNPQTDNHPAVSAEAGDSSSSSDSATLTAAESATGAPGTVPPGSSDSSQGDSSTTSHMEQTLQKMYQQRQQLQAQQNHPAQAPAQ
jgi:hypothetical protein